MTIKRSAHCETRRVILDGTLRQPFRRLDIVYARDKSTLLVQHSLTLCAKRSMPIDRICTSAARKPDQPCWKEFANRENSVPRSHDTAMLLRDKTNTRVDYLLLSLLLSRPLFALCSILFSYVVSHTFLLCSLESLFLNQQRSYFCQLLYYILLLNLMYWNVHSNIWPLKVIKRLVRKHQSHWPYQSLCMEVDLHAQQCINKIATNYLFI